MSSNPHSVALPGFADPVAPGSKKNPIGSQESRRSKTEEVLPNNVTDGVKSQREGDLQVKKSAKLSVASSPALSLYRPTNEPGTMGPQDHTTGIDTRSPKQLESSGTGTMGKNTTPADLTKTVKPVVENDRAAEKDPSVGSLPATDVANVKVSSLNEITKPVGENSTAVEKECSVESQAAIDESGSAIGTTNTKVSDTVVEVLEKKKPPQTPPHTPASVLEQVTSPVRVGMIQRIRARKSVLADSIKSRSPPSTPQDKASTSKRNKEAKGKRKSGSVLETASAGKKPRGAAPQEVFCGAPTEDVGVDWTGWTKRTFQRAGGATKGSFDSYWYTPKMELKLRSLKEVQRFVGHLKTSNGDEQLAWKKLKGKK